MGLRREAPYIVSFSSTLPHIYTPTGHGDVDDRRAPTATRPTNDTVRRGSWDPNLPSVAPTHYRSWGVLSGRTPAIPHTPHARRIRHIHTAMPTSPAETSIRSSAYHAGTVSGSTPTSSNVIAGISSAEAVKASSSSSHQSQRQRRTTPTTSAARKPSTSSRKSVSGAERTRV